MRAVSSRGFQDCLIGLPGQIWRNLPLVCTQESGWEVKVQTGLPGPSPPCKSLPPRVGLRPRLGPIQSENVQMSTLKVKQKPNLLATFPGGPSHSKGFGVQGQPEELKKKGAFCPSDQGPFPMGHLWEVAQEKAKWPPRDLHFCCWVAAPSGLSCDASTEGLAPNWTSRVMWNPFWFRT